MTFAAPTAGNLAFAQAFHDSFPNSWQYYNQEDIIQMASATISNMGDLYSPAPQASQIVQTFTFTIFDHTFNLNVSLQQVRFWTAKRTK
ncbi:MAG TPA: hypothetical protein VLZ81_03180 [Blastocatellia bacterium]|nr:hypothetical protein [Blastocatellia bacterium]